MHSATARDVDSCIEVRVAFVIDADGTLFVIHAQPLTEKDKRIYRRRNK